MTSLFRRMFDPIRAAADAYTAELEAENARLRKRTHEIQEEESKRHAAIQADAAHFEMLYRAAMDQCHDWYEKHKALKAEVARTRADAIEECACVVKYYAGYDVGDWPPAVLRQAAEACRALLGTQEASHKPEKGGCSDQTAPTSPASGKASLGHATPYENAAGATKPEEAPP